MKAILWGLYALLSLLPAAVSLVVLPGLPAQIPAHYGLDGMVDRWGSRYEVLIFPAIILLFAGVLLGVVRLAARQGKAGKTVSLLAALLGLVLFNALNGVFLYTAASRVENLYAMPLDPMRLTSALLGLLLMVLGPFLPQVPRNRMVGLRTRWSLQNDRIWQQSQQFCGRSLLVAGAVMIGLSFLLSGLACVVVLLLVLLLLGVVDTWYTWILAKRDKTIANPSEKTGNIEKNTRL